MDMNQEWERFTSGAKTYFIWALSGLVDAVFLSLWMVVQWFVDTQVISRLALAGIDKWVCNALQVVLGVSTLGPVVIYVIQDLAIISLRAMRRIKREKEAMNGERSNG